MMLRCIRCHCLKEDAYCPTCLRQLCQGFDVAEITAEAKQIAKREEELPDNGDES